MSTPSDITLKYWNGRGLMEVPRIMMAIGGKSYNDVRISDPGSAGDMSANLGRVPICETAEGSIGQSAAINFYVASINGLMGSTPLESAQIIAFEEHLRELMTAFRGLVPYATEPTTETLDKFFDLNDASDYTGVADGSKRGSRFLLWFLGRMEAVLPGDGYCVGGKLTLADVLMFAYFGDNLAVDETLSELPSHRRETFASKERVEAALAKHPKIRQIVENVRNHTSVKKWLETRGKQGF